tara:strand:- start:360 stop:731 length:372 start_codon:yes stop_codon:yes gene_type:complete
VSTRAVYTFANFEAYNFKDQHVHVHQEGHPEGAAIYFDNMIYFADLSEPSDPDLLNQFVFIIERIGLKAIPQANRLDAGDLKWGYTLTYIKPLTIDVTVHRIKNGTETQHWSGTLMQFLKDHL